MEIDSLLEKYLMIIGESPMVVSPFTTQYRHYQDRGMNNLLTKKLYGNYTPIDTFETFDIFKDENEWLVTDKNYIYAAFLTKEVDNGIHFTGAWQMLETRVLARSVIFGYFLKRFAYIQSDKTHTPFGKAYWQAIIETALTEHYKVELISRIEEPLTISDIETANRYWGDDINFANYTFRIYSKHFK